MNMTGLALMLLLNMLAQSATERPIPDCVVNEDELQVYNAALSNLLGNKLHVLVLEDKTELTKR